MKLLIGGSTYCKNNLISELQNLKSVWYDFAELDLGHPIELNEELIENISKAKEFLPILVGHLPEIDFKKEEIDKCKSFISVLSKLNINIFVVHLFCRNLSTKDNLETKISGLQELADFARSNNSILVLENTEEDSIILKEVFDRIPNLNFCLDIGHANLFAEENRSIELIENFGWILSHIHAHDNKGWYSENSDLHLPIGEWNIDFEKIINKLKEIDYTGNITLEIFSPNKEWREKSINIIKSLT